MYNKKQKKVIKKIVNGQVSVNYTISENVKTKEYKHLLSYQKVEINLKILKHKTFTY